MAISRVCVFCASSRRVHADYVAAARTMGETLARAGLTVVYGGGAIGLMGTVADAALAQGGTVEGIIPRFMVDLEQGHRGVSKLHTVDGMQERLQLMLDLSHAFVALPGGCGTLEELFYVLTRKRLGLTTAPMVIVNTRGYFDPCLAMLERCVAEGFMDERHGAMWSVVSSAGEAVEAVRAGQAWSPENARFAVP